MSFVLWFAWQARQWCCPEWLEEDMESWDSGRCYLLYITHSGLEQDISWGRKREKDYKGSVSVGGRGFNGDSRRQAKSRNGRFMDHPLGISVSWCCAEIRHGWKEIKDRAALSSPQEAGGEGHLKFAICWIKDFQDKTSMKVPHIFYHVSTMQYSRI